MTNGQLGFSTKMIERDRSAAHSSSIGYSIPIQEVGNARVSSLDLRVSIDGDDRLLFDGSRPRYSLETTTKNICSVSQRTL
ncbi:hypothetical protein EVAR_14519_1 [Eumeta japonica]|uniref:Uncharacterized protein n=1 Tax=Eumeta variegata TaxID=151549 RepID=A0A4C1U330_EUMVA|nr:hypothetical protein EVAR_14519_1 [Eumeta japonica]